MMKLTWKKGLALLLTLTLVFGFSLQAVASEATREDVAMAGEGPAAVLTAENGETPAPQAGAPEGGTPEGGAPAAFTAPEEAPDDALYVTLYVGEGTYGELIPVTDGKIAMPAEPAKDVWPEGASSFRGWFTQPEGGERFDPATTITGPLSLYAQFSSSSYLIQFKNQDGHVMDSYELALDGLVVETQKPLIPAEGQHFLYWALEGTTEEFTGFGQPATGDMTFIPIFDDAYYVFFYSEGTAIDPVLVPKGKPVAEPEAPKRMGYSFKHWSTEKNGEAAYDFSSAVNSALNLYAVWTPEQVGYEVVYWMEKPNIDRPADQLVWPDDYTTFSSAVVQKENGVNAGTEVTNITELPNVPEMPTVQYFEYQKTVPTTILGNGHTVVNVCYSRIVYTMEFTFAKGTPNMNSQGEDANAVRCSYGGFAKLEWASFTGRGTEEIPAPEQKPGFISSTAFAYNDVSLQFEAKYQQDISKLWPTPGSSVNISFYYITNAGTEWARPMRTGSTPWGWVSPSNRAEGVIATVNGPRATLSGDIIPAEGNVIRWNPVYIDSPATQTVEFYMEALPSQQDVAQPPMSGLVTNDSRDPAKGNTDGRVYVLDESRTETNLSDSSSYIFDTIPGFITAGKLRVTEGKNVHDYVYYNREQLSLNFNLQGGTKAAGMETQVTGILHESPLSYYNPNPDDDSAKDPTKAGYTFAGWFYDSAYKLPVNWEQDLALYSQSKSGQPVREINLFAKWESSDNTVRYYDNKANASQGGAAGLLAQQGVANNASAVDKLVTMTVEEQEYTLVPGAEVPGYGKFLGWYWTMDSKQDTVFSYEMPINRSYNLFAHWATDGYTLTYEKGEATEGDLPAYNANATYHIGQLERVLGNTGNLAVEGKVFAGWLNNLTGQVYYGGQLVEIKGNTVLTAQFVDKSNYYTLTFKPGYANSGQEDVVFNVPKNKTETKLADANTFTRDGYELVGWTSGGKTYAPSEVYSVTGNAEFEAIWKTKGPTPGEEVKATMYLTLNEVEKNQLGPVDTNLFVMMGAKEQVSITVPEGMQQTVGESYGRTLSNADYDAIVLNGRYTEAQKQAALTALANKYRNVVGQGFVFPADTQIQWTYIKLHADGWHLDAEVTMPPPKPVTLTAASASKPYDGTALILEDITDESKAALKEGDFAEVKMTAASKSVVNVADSRTGNNVIGSYAIYRMVDGVKTDVTAEYAVTPAPGTLTITPVKITVVITPDQTKEFGGPDPGYDYTVEDEGGNVIPTPPGMVVNPGRDPADEGKENRGDDITITANPTNPGGNYDITVEDAKLTITPKPITVEGKTDTVPFTGNEQTLTGVKPVALVGSDVLTFAPQPSVSGTLPKDKYDMVVDLENALINGVKYDPATSNYALTAKDGWLIITPPGAGQKLDWDIIGTPTGAQPYTGGQQTGNDGYTVSGLPTGFTLVPNSITVNAPVGTNVKANENGTGADAVYAQTLEANGFRIEFNGEDVTHLFNAPGFTAGTMTITPVVVTISPVTANDEYSSLKGNNLPGLSLNYDSFVGGDNENNAFTGTARPSVNNGGLNKDTADNYTLSVDMNGAVAAYGNYTFQFTTKDYTVQEAGFLSYNNNGHAIKAVPGATGPYGQGTPAPVNTADLSQNGLKFLGWAYDPAAKTPDFEVGQPGETAPFTAAQAAGGVTLYAVVVADFGPNGVDAAAENHTSEYNGLYKTDDGKDKSITVAPQYPTDTVIYSLSNAVDADGKLQAPVANPAYKDVATNADGFYTVYYQVERGGFYSEVKSATVTINPRAVTVAPVAGGSIKRGDALPGITTVVGNTLVAGDDLNLSGTGSYTVPYDQANPVSGELTISFSADPGPAWNNPNYNVSFGTGTLTVIPAWNVAYDANGGNANTVPTDSSYYAAGEDVTVDKNIQPTRDGFIFLGWDQNQNATDPAYKAGEDAGFEMPNLATGGSNNDDAKQTLYAIWQLDSDSGLYSINNINKVYDGRSGTIEVSGLPEGATVNYSYVDANGGTQTSTTPPSFENVARGAGNSVETLTVTATVTYKGVQASKPFTGTVLIRPRPIAIASGNAADAIYNAAAQTGTNSALSDRTAEIADNYPEWDGQFGLVNGQLLSGTATATETNAGTYNLVLADGFLIQSGAGNVSANYAEVVAERRLGTFTILPAQASIIPQNNGKMYGGAEPALEATAAGLQGEDSFAYTLSRVDGENAGTYDINVNIEKGNYPNYIITTETGVFTIAPRDVNVMITPNNNTKVYGTAEPTLTASVTGTVNGDTLNYTLNREAGENTGSYSITVELGNNPNYKIATGTAVFTVTPAPLTLAVNSFTKATGEQDPEFTANVSGLVGSDTLVYTLSRTEGEEVGVYDINAAHTPNPNYTVTVVPGTLTILDDVNIPVITPTTPTDTTAPAAPGGPGAPAPAAPGAPAAPVAAPPAVTANPLAGLGTLLGALATVDDPGNPLAGQTANIGDNQVPLIGLNSWALINLILAVGTVLLSLVLLVTYFTGRRKKEEENPDADYEYEHHTETGRKEEEQSKRRKKLIVRLLSVLVAVIAVIAFILTEDMSLPMVLADKWTLLMAIIALVQVVVAFFAKKTNKQQDDDEAENTPRPMNA